MLLSVGSVERDSEELLDGRGFQGRVLGLVEDRAQVTADGLEADTEHPGLLAQDAQLEENGDREGLAQEAPEHEIAEQTAVPVWGRMARLARK